MIIKKHIKHLFTLIFATALSLVQAQDYHTVGGELTGVNAWSDDGVPYHVTSNIIINDSSSLTIEPGVTVLFDQFVNFSVNGGQLFIEGTKNDSVNLCSFSDGDWSGVIVRNIHSKSYISLKHINFENAETALMIKDCNDISVENCRFENTYIGGVAITNSNNCIIDSCIFQNNYKSVTLSGDTELCTGNVIKNNKITNGNVGIALNSSNGGSCHDNIIENNFFGKSTTAMIFDSSNSKRNKKNTIRKNVIACNIDQLSGLSATGVSISMDSVYIENNIFWRNGIAVNFMSNKLAFIVNNTFYDNTVCFSNFPVAINIPINRNVFMKADNVCTFKRNNQVYFSENNFFRYKMTQPLLINDSNSDISMIYNYWDCDSDAEIAEMIYDKNDDGQLGEIIYRPALEDYSTTAPISPPTNVVKQEVDGGVLVSWNANPESDAAFYRLHYHNFNYYEFESAIDSLHDTTFFLPDANIDDDFAVTCADKNYHEGGQKDGHESAYSLAEAMPYAGKDNTLCYWEEFYDIEDATIPFAHDSIAWNTSGTGSFSDASAINPKYFPSEIDKRRGNVTLTLNVFCYSNSTEYTDSSVLTISKNVVAFAGNDAAHIYGTPIMLNEAYTVNSSSVTWSSGGDGHFDDVHSIKPQYTYGVNDSLSGAITLTMKAFSPCGDTSDVVNIYLVDTLNLYGTVSCCEKPVANAQVVAIGTKHNVVNRMYRTASDENGDFKFSKIFNNNYILFAVPDTVSQAGNPAYYESKRTWTQADQVVAKGDTYDVDIKLPASLGLIEGEGSIKGAFDYPDGYFSDSAFYCSDWFGRDDSTAFCEEGLSNVSVLLLNSNMKYIITYSLTDYGGKFHFDNLPYGSYYLMADLPRYRASSPQLITIAPESPTVEDLHFYIDKNKIELKGNDAYTIETTDALVYPNPVKDKFILNLPDGFAIEKIEILDLSGRAAPFKPTNQTPLQIDISSLSNGIYLLKAIGLNGEVYVEKIIKTRWRN